MSMSTPKKPQGTATFLTLRNKLIIGFAVPLIMIALLGFLATRSNSTIADEFNHVADDVSPALIALENVRFAGLRIIAATSEFVLLDSLGIEEDDEEEEAQEGEEEEIASGILIYEEALVTLEQIIAEKFPDKQEAVDAIAAAGVVLIADSNRILDLVESGAENEEIFEAKEDLETAERTFLASVDAAIEAELQELAQGEEAVNAAIAATSTVVLTSTVAVTVIALLLAAYIYRSTTAPLTRLETAAVTIREGKFDIRVPVTIRDEIGQLTETFNTMAEAIEYRDKEQIAKLEEQLVEVEAARAEAERSDQVKSAFLASMSHELRTPLNAVINFTKFVAQGDLGPVNEQQKETLFEAVDSARHLLTLINDVLDMSKIESGSLTLFVQDNVDLKDILNTVTATGQVLLEDKSVVIETEIAADLPRIRGDKQRIRQIVLNMMSNACKFTTSGHITLRAKTDGDEVIIAVEDTGVGIAPEDQALVFEPFKQTDSGLRKGGGTGLGMPISKNLAEIHGGRLWLESVPGQGTTFFVMLPVKSDELEPVIT